MSTTIFQHEVTYSSPTNQVAIQWDIKIEKSQYSELTHGNLNVLGEGEGVASIILYFELC